MSSASTTKHKKLHIALFPWLAFGHIIPFLEVAKHIARRGHKVSFISTPRNIKRLPKIPETLTPLITLVQIPLPRVENLPENAEATMDVPYDVIPYLKIAHNGLEQGISEFLRENSPDWIIHEYFSPHWLPQIAINLGVSTAHFSIFSASSLCFFGSTSMNRMSRYSSRTKPEHFTVPPEWIPFPSNIYFRLFEAKRVFEDAMKTNVSGVDDGFRLESTIQGCQVYFIRSCREIEGEWLDLLEDLHQKAVVLPTGLLPPSLPRSDEEGKDSTWSKVAEWLDKQEKGKVVYVAFGSEPNLSQEEFNELALGLELSGLPFFWVLKKPSHGSGDGDLIKLPDGFLDRTKDRGIVWTTWAPQLQILSHESVGGFLTHCGSSSLIEALQYGRPLIMLPLMYDQGLIARKWDKKIGIEVPRDEESGWFTRNELAESLKLIVIDEEGKPYREGANEYSNKLFSDKELHDRYMDKCVEYLENHAHHEV